MRNLLLLFAIMASVSIQAVDNYWDVLPYSANNYFHTFLLEKVDSLDTERKEAVALALASEETLKERQEMLYNNYLTILGDFPEKTPLEAKILDTITNDDVYRIERLHYQSVPNHHVTANFYIPDTGSAPYPSVIITCGHYPVAKTYEDYQKLAILFARHGIAALIVDPVGQGERYQMQNSNGSLKYDGQSGTTEATMLDVASMLNGTSTSAYELWDNHRGVDYLYSRTDIVDTAKIGCTGHSGGGAQATFLLAYDKRLKAGAVANFLMNRPTLYKTIGPQTGSQNISYEGAYSIDHPDYISMFAPKPFMMIATTVDFFDIGATRETYSEVKDVYDTLDAPDKIKLFQTSDAHDYTKVKREAAVRWFSNWFYDNNDTIIESGSTVLTDAELEITTSGQVMTEWDNELSVVDLNIALTDSLEKDREAFWTDNSKEFCINKIKELLRLAPHAQVTVADSGSIDRGHYTLQRIVINSGSDVAIPAHLYTPKEIDTLVPAVVYVDGVDKAYPSTPGGIIEKNFMDKGYIALAIDVRGFGETDDADDKNESKHNNVEHRNAVISAYVGKTLIGQRVEDVMKAVDLLQSNSDVDTNNIIVVGTKKAGPVVLHAGAVDARIDDVRIYESSTTSWLDIVAHPEEADNLTHVIPGALKHYDLPDLVDAIAPRPVTVSDNMNPLDINERTASEANNTLHSYPNPTKGLTSIDFNLNSAGNVTINLYNLQGRKIDVLFSKYSQAGNNRFSFDANKYPGGTYFFQMVVDNSTTVSQKVMIVK